MTGESPRGIKVQILDACMPEVAALRMEGAFGMCERVQDPHAAAEQPCGSDRTVPRAHASDEHTKTGRTRTTVGADDAAASIHAGCASQVFDDTLGDADTTMQHSQVGGLVPPTWGCDDESVAPAPAVAKTGDAEHGARVGEVASTGSISVSNAMIADALQLNTQPSQSHVEQLMAAPPPKSSSSGDIVICAPPEGAHEDAPFQRQLLPSFESVAGGRGAPATPTDDAPTQRLNEEAKQVNVPACLERNSDKRGSTCETAPEVEAPTHIRVADSTGARSDTRDEPAQEARRPARSASGCSTLCP
ncbi:hypothetical protein EON66_06905, partial [archaeon]